MPFGSCWLNLHVHVNLPEPVLFTSLDIKLYDGLATELYFNIMAGLGVFPLNFISKRFFHVFVALTVLVTQP